ncbi:MAG: hypothetical protein HC895_19090 [Leptolyngbyaceae cyanobacterium SM1_3_5]|nr:hypothetical protein [Leptolyngbyaceae cyanobacterium SM1_3_5]
MRSTLSKLRPLRFLMAAFVATIVFFTYAFPALAISAPKSDPREGEAPINDIYELSEDALKGGPPGLEATSKPANQGLNEVQADADAEKMVTTEDSKEAVTAQDQVEKVLERITGKD